MSMDLDFLIRSQRRSWKMKEKKIIMKDILSGLVYIHSGLPNLGPVIHRDLKPSNILISKFLFLFH